MKNPVLDWSRINEQVLEAEQEKILKLEKKIRELEGNLSWAKKCQKISHQVIVEEMARIEEKSIREKMGQTYYSGVRSGLSFAKGATSWHKDGLD